jgi:hypothetical protein
MQFYFKFKTEKMRAVLINSTKKTVTDIEISESNTLKDWYKAIGCNFVEVGAHINYDDSILVDEEGLMGLSLQTQTSLTALTNQTQANLNDTTPFFMYEGDNTPFCGNGLVVGMDDEGNSVSCHISALEVAAKVSFKCLGDLTKYYNQL